MANSFELTESEVTQINHVVDDILTQDADWQELISKYTELVNKSAPNKEILKQMMEFLTLQMPDSVEDACEMVLAAIAIGKATPQQLIDAACQKLQKPKLRARASFISILQAADAFGSRFGHDPTGHPNMCTHCQAKLHEGAACCDQCGTKVRAPSHNPMCGHCKKPNPQDAVFCMFCATRIAPPANCPACAASLATNAKWCPKCCIKLSIETEQPAHIASKVQFQTQDFTSPTQFSSFLMTQTKVLQQIAQSIPKATNEDSDEDEETAPKPLAEKPLNTAAIQALLRAYNYNTAPFWARAVATIATDVLTLKSGPPSPTETKTLIKTLSSAIRDILQDQHTGPDRDSPISQQRQAALERALSTRLTPAQIRKLTTSKDKKKREWDKQKGKKEDRNRDWQQTRRGRPRSHSAQSKFHQPSRSRSRSRSPGPKDPNHH